jgi:hypothetical protein
MPRRSILVVEVLTNQRYLFDRSLEAACVLFIGIGGIQESLIVPMSYTAGGG